MFQLCVSLTGWELHHSPAPLAWPGAGVSEEHYSSVHLVLNPLSAIRLESTDGHRMERGVQIPIIRRSNPSTYMSCEVKPISFIS